MKRLLTAAAVVVALAGCGDDGDGAPSAAGAAEPPAYVAKADAICKAANTKETALGGGTPGWMFEDQYDDRRFLRRFTDVGRAAARDLRELDAPAEDRDHAQAMLTALDRMVEALDVRIAALRSGKGMDDMVDEYMGGYGDLVAAAGSLGLSECQGVLL